MNGVRIIVELGLKDKVVELKRVGDTIIAVRLVRGMRQSMLLVPMCRK